MSRLPARSRTSCRKTSWTGARRDAPAATPRWPSWRRESRRSPPTSLVDDNNRDSIGVIIASSGALQLIGEQELVAEARGIGRVDPLTVPRVGQYSAAVRVGRLMEVRGPNSSVNSACASGGDAIGQALNMLRLGQADCMIAGGAEAMIGRVVVSSLAASAP